VSDAYNFQLFSEEARGPLAVRRVFTLKSIRGPLAVRRVFTLKSIRGPLAVRRVFTSEVNDGCYRSLSISRSGILHVKVKWLRPADSTFFFEECTGSVVAMHDC
jgi:hypothetical protein